MQENNPVLAEFVNRYKAKFAGKVFLMPENIDYAIPYSEKQFIGNIPWLSCVNIQDKAFSLGIAWNNVGKERVDLDLHLRSPNSSYGWNSSLSSNSREIIYSGDMTDATNGAAEAFYFKKVDDEPYLLSVNKYAGPEKVDFTFFASTMPIGEKYASYVYDPNTAIFAAPMLIEGNQASLGMFYRGKFYFYGGSFNGYMIPLDYDKQFIGGMVDTITNGISLGGFLAAAGATIYHNEEEMLALPDNLRARVIDLRVNALTPTTILDIVDEVI